MRFKEAPPGCSPKPRRRALRASARVKSGDINSPRESSPTLIYSRPAPTITPVAAASLHCHCRSPFDAASLRCRYFINDAGADLPDEDDNRRLPHRPILMQEDQEDVEEMERRVKERYSKSNQIDYAEDATDVEQQALLPSVKDPKLWMVKCAV
ncbi:hypothetical protein GW17_00001131 [Ensete ventricosum]|nr:hypothetical protein GW17_00001131 [Ensete ventricosum]